MIEISKENKINSDLSHKIFEPEEKEKITFPSSSVCGQILMERALRKLVLIFLIINMAFLLLSAEYYIEERSEMQLDAIMLNDLLLQSSPPDVISKFCNFIIEKQLTHSYPYLMFKYTVGGKTATIVNDSKLMMNLRPSEIYIYQLNHDDIEILLINNMSVMASREYSIQLASMMFACLVVLFAFLCRYKDAYNFVQKPLSIILALVNKVIRRPIDLVANPRYYDHKFEMPELKELEDEHLMIALEICKIVPFLGYAYGSRQVDIIADTILVKGLKQSDSKGRTIRGIFIILKLPNLGNFVEEDNFTAFSFVRKIFDVVYRTADKFKGEATLTRDSSFMITYRVESLTQSKQLTTKHRESAEIASLAITSLLKIITKISTLKELQRIDTNIFKTNSSENEMLFGSLLGENFLSSGDLTQLIVSTMHFGEAYEFVTATPGLVSVSYSGMSIDTCKKMMKVATLNRLPVLLTEKVFGLLSECIKKQCRKVDYILFSTEELPLEIFCMDLDTSSIMISEQASEKFDLEPDTALERRYLHVHIKEMISEFLIMGAKNIVFLEDPDIQAVFSNRRVEFNRIFRKALDFYTLGAWDLAKTELEQALNLDPQDGASKFLYNLLMAYNFEKPDQWRGYRYIS